MDSKKCSPVLPCLPVKANVLVDQVHNARLADFGLLTIISDPAHPLTSSSYAQGGTARWMGPELISPKKFGLKTSCPTKSSDCYSLGMVIYETISGSLPFHEDSDLTVFVKVLKGKRPRRGVWFSDGLWKVMEQCWIPQPSKRPSVEGVLQCLDMCSDSSRPHSSGIDGRIVESLDSSNRMPVLGEQEEDNSSGYSTLSDSQSSEPELDGNHSSLPPTDQPNPPPTPSPWLSPFATHNVPLSISAEDLSTGNPLVNTQSVASGPHLRTVLEMPASEEMQLTVPLVDNRGESTFCSASISSLY